MILNIGLACLVNFFQPLLIACKSTAKEYHDALAVANFDNFIFFVITWWSFCEIGVLSSVKVQSFCCLCQKALLWDSREDNSKYKDQYLKNASNIT